MASNKRNIVPSLLQLFVVAWVAGACSTSSRVPDGDQLYTGLDHVKYVNYENNDHAVSTKEEVEAALACKPNGALFGSSYHRTPFPYALWIWNAFSDSQTKFGQWITKTFGKPPVLMSRVNPALRASVAQSALRVRGYFRGKVGYEIVETKNPKKAKLGYTVDMGHLFVLDTIEYANFPAEADSLIRASEKKRKISAGDPFDVSMLDAERTRLSTLFRNNGYYYYQPGYASYFADTLRVPGKVQLKLQMADSLPDMAKHKWYIGKVDVNLRKTMLEQLNDSLVRRRFTVHFNGRRSPIRMRVITRDLKLRTKELYSYEKYIESVNNIGGNGLFSMVDFRFTPCDSSATCDTLNMMVNCFFEKPYDFYIEGNMTGKTNGLVGPGLMIGFTKRNVFRGGEKFDFNLHGSYEWQTGHDAEGSSSEINSYEYGGDASLEFPRLIMPFIPRRKRFYAPPSTLLKGSVNIVNRAKYFRRHIISGELTYNVQTSERSRHRFSPLILEYNYINTMTDEFADILDESPYLKIAMRDQFIPKLSYTYTYTSALNHRHPIYWETTFSESANILSLGYVAFGEKWGEKDKTMFKNPYAQFFKIETDFRKTWSVGEHSQLVGHLGLGVIRAYGNSTTAPYSEQFYVGGANSIRAFNVRSIGPGGYYTSERKYSYMDQTGDLKFLANLEYRMRLFGNLHGALFLDAGNVWTLKDDDRADGKFEFKNFFNQLAVGTGVGIRYDLDFFVFRLDWGVGIHLPYKTDKSGYYNIPSFKDGQSFHLAIGYPF